jgi:hypothetical protein
MKTRSGVQATLALVLAMIFAGCATHRIDWNSRIGTYNFDQAVTEFGPPDKQAKLSDGRLVAEWISRYYTGTTAAYTSYPGGVVIVQPPSTYEDRLRLTFGTNNALTAWSKK